MPYIQLNRQQLRERLQAKWDATTALPMPFWASAEANFAINEALQWYNLYTGVWRQRINTATVANQVWYETPSTFVYNVRMEYNGKPLAMASLGDLDNGHPNWEFETTATSGAPSEVSIWAPVGLNRFVLWPADATGQNSILIDGVHDTPILTADQDTIDIDESEVDAILGEALYISAFKDGGRSPRTAGWHQEFVATVLAHNDRLNASDAFRQFAGLDLNRSTRPLAAK